MYGTARLGIYFSFQDYFKNKNDGGNLTAGQKIFSSICAGGLGSFIGNPCDLALVRMQTDAILPEAERRNYKHAGDALKRIVSEEGVTSLWKGSLPTVCRAVSLNVGMLVSFDESKERLEKIWGPCFKSTFVATLISGVFTSTMSLPFDNVKTKLQRMSKNAAGEYPYTGFFDCFRKSVANESIAGLWAGLPTYYFRVAPHAMITLLVSEKLKSAFK